MSWIRQQDLQVIKVAFIAVLPFPKHIIYITFVISDFSNETVFNNSHTLKPLFYKVSGTWGNHEGSLLLWLLVLSIFLFIFLFVLSVRPPYILLNHNHF